MHTYKRLHDYRFSEADVDDIRGSAVYGLKDDKLGKIDDVIFDSATAAIRYVVVDTGGWLSSKRFIVPADRLSASSAHEGNYHVDLTKSQIESFPPYDENAIESQEKWQDYEDRYQTVWTSSPVQHREGTERNITPAASESRLGQRWNSFEARMRKDRANILAHCDTYFPQSVRTESQQRKVG